MPESLSVAVTDSPDSLAAWLSERGQYRVLARASDTVRVAPADARGGPPLVLHHVRAREARDAIDAGVDVLLTSDPDAVAYAATRPDLASLPLAWNRTYALLVPAAPPMDSASRTTPLIDTLRAELAAGAVRVEARGAPAASSADDGMCSTASPAADAPATASSPPVILYVRGDDVSRSIAARLVALGAAPRTPLGALAPSLAARGDSLRAVGADAADVLRILEAGGAAAAVVAVSSRPVLACPAGHAPAPRVPLDSIALVQTRERLIVRRGLTGRSLDALLRAAGDSSGGGP
jgi:hypothetical protein